MRLFRLLCFVCLIFGAESAPTLKGRDKSNQILQDNSLVYSLFLRLMSNGDLRSWINQYVLKSFGRNGGSILGSQSISQNDGKQNLQGHGISTSKAVEGSSNSSVIMKLTTTPNLTIERDYVSPVFKTTTTVETNDLTVERDHLFQTTPSNLRGSTRSTPGYTIPIIKLTGPDSQKIVNPGTTTAVNLTVIRDYQDPGPTTGSPPKVVRRKRSWQIPVVKLETKADYNRPGGVPSQSNLQDENGQPLTVVRDSLDSQDGDDNDMKPTTTEAPPRRYYYALEPCVPGASRLCFRLKYT